MTDCLDLSIVIPMYNGREFVSNCLNSIKKTVNNLSYEVIIVDDASTDGSGDIVKNDFPWVKVIRNDKSQYFNGANNIGFQAARGFYCMTLNQDTEMKDNAIEIMLNYLREHPNVGLVSSQLYYPDGSKQINCWKFRNLPGIIANSQIFKTFSFLYPSYYEKVYRTLRYLDNSDEEKEVDNIMGACMMGPTSLIKKIGGFDEDIKFGYTDDVLCAKIRREGFKIVHLSKGYVVHYEVKLFKYSAHTIDVKNKDVINYANRYVGRYASLVLYPLNYISRMVNKS